MLRTLAILLLAITPLAHAQLINRVNVYGTAGKSMTNWHGQADLATVNFEFDHAISPRWEFGVALAPMTIEQPRSWFGNEFGEGNEKVQAIGTALIARRNFFTDSARASMYVEISSGPMWSEKRVPASTSHFNFLSSGGVGVVLRPQQRYPVIVGVRFGHISNGGYSDRNPGLNISSLVIGTRFRR
ncbi:MAG TPA: acyloxyacyl hydrolase [Thermoanaerobaculia bacterium]|nr:acyloxyacyl hydrolase [Thermoanaerobaculia bacterium]